MRRVIAPALDSLPMHNTLIDGAATMFSDVRRYVSSRPHRYIETCRPLYRPIAPRSVLYSLFPDRYFVRVNFIPITLQIVLPLQRVGF